MSTADPAYVLLRAKFAGELALAELELLVLLLRAFKKSAENTFVFGSELTRSRYEPLVGVSCSQQHNWSQQNCICTFTTGRLSTQHLATSGSSALSGST